MVFRYRADEGDVDVMFRDGGEPVQNGRLKSKVVDLRGHARCAEGTDDPRQLRQHEVIHVPVLAAGRLDADLPEDRLDPHGPEALDQSGRDVKYVLVEDEVRLERLDLGEENALELFAEARAEPNASR